MAVTKLTAKQQHDLKKFVKELQTHRGRHTELVTVYVPAGYELTKIIQQLQQEQGTAVNIKSASTRKNVQDALERMIQHLRLFKRTPENGLAIFSGNIAPEGKHDVQVWSLEPPIAVSTKIYRCDKLFQTDLLEQMVQVKEVYGMVLMDRREGTIASLKGKSIQVLSKHTSNVPGKMRAGGQCLAPDTLVQMADGTVKEIQDVHIGETVLSTRDYKQLSQSKVIDTWQSKKEILSIRTKNPVMSIDASPEHTMFVLTNQGIEEKTAGMLQTGDVLLLPDSLTLQGELQKITHYNLFTQYRINDQGRKILTETRIKRKLRQRDVAMQIGVTQTTISFYETGKNNPHTSILRSICDLYNISWQSFLDRHCTPLATVSLPSILDEKMAQFVGYVLGDGTIEEDRITLFEQRYEVAMKYKLLFDSYFGLHSSYKYRESKSYHQLRFTSRPLVRLLKQDFSELKVARNSEVPQKIMKSPGNVVAGFLRGLFDAEGFVVTRGVGLGINNKKLAYQIQQLLLRFSIISSVHTYDNKRNPYSNNTRYTIDITEKKSLEHYASHIQFTALTKNSKLSEIIARKSNTSYTRQILSSGKDVRAILQTHGYTPNHFPTVSNFFNNERNMSKTTFERSILQLVPRTVQKELMKLDSVFVPTQITEITPRAKQLVIDISVEDQNFLANGLLVHNSAARFGRIRENAAKEFYIRMGEYMKEAFFGNPDLKGIILGGPGPTKHEFMDGPFITNELKQKIIAVKDVTYTDEFGLQELLEKSDDVLASEEVQSEKKVMGTFFNYLNTNDKMVTYGKDDVLEKLRMGAVDILLVSESLTDEDIEMWEKEAEAMGTTVEIISTETREGVQLKEFGGIAGILRYEVHQ